MTDRMRKALELIAEECVRLMASQSGTEWLRGEIGRVRAIAQAELTALAAQDSGIRISDGMADLMAQSMAAQSGERVTQGMGSQFNPGPRLQAYSAADAAGLADAKQRADDAYNQMMGYMLPPLIVRDLLK